MNKTASVVFAVALSAGSLNLARADQPGPDWMPAEQVKQKVLQSGYSQVTKLKADDGRWEGEGIKNGKEIFGTFSLTPIRDPAGAIMTPEKLEGTKRTTRRKATD